MITKYRKRAKCLPEKHGGKLITVPGQYVKVKDALRQYSDIPYEQKAAHFYETEGMPIPEFDKMDKIEKLEALNEWRQRAQDQKLNLEQLNTKAQKRQEAKEAKEEQQKLNKLLNEKQQQQTITTTGATT